MIKEIFGKKIAMTQIFTDEGEVIPTTLIEVEPVCLMEIVEYKTKIRARIGCFKILGKKVNKVAKPVKGYFDKLSIDAYKLIREVEIDEKADFSILNKAPEAIEAKNDDMPPVEANQEKALIENEGVEGDINKETTEKHKVKEEAQIPASRYIGLEIFNIGDIVDVQAVNKGKGFAGGMKRHNWAGQPAAHGSTMHRRVGSIGASATPSRVQKGIRMPGHMGNKLRTIKNLKIIKVDKERNLLFIAGSMPGARGAILRIKKVK